MSDEVDECYEFHPAAEDGACASSALVVARQASVPKVMEDTTQVGYLHEGRLIRRRRRSVSLHSVEQAGATDISLRGCVSLC